MPEIPQAVAPTLTPPPEMNPRIAGRPGAAMADAAEQMGSVAEMGFHVAEKIKKAQDEGILLGAENQIGADIEKAQSGLANWTDYTHADQLKQDTATALQEKYAEQYGNRPDLWRHIEPYLVRQTNEFNGLVDKKAAQLTADYNESALIVSNNKTISDAANEPTLEGKQLHWAIGDAKITAMVQNHSISAVEGVNESQRIRTDTIETEVERAANPLNAPEIMEAEMTRLKEYEGKGIVKPDRLERMTDLLAKAYETALARSDRIDTSKIGDAVISSDAKDPTLKDQSTGEIDYLQAAKRVDDNPDLSTKVKKYVREEYEQRDALQKRIVAERNQKIFNSLDDRIGNTDAKGGALTPSEVKQRRELPPSDPKWIPQEVADHALKGLKQYEKETRATNAQERMMMRQETDYESAQVMRQMISTPGYIQSESELYTGDAAKLTKSDRTQVWASKNIKGAKEYEDAHKMMSASPIYPNTDEGNAKFSRDTLLLRQRVEANHLVGSQILDEAQKIMKPQEEVQHKEDVKGLLDNLWPVAKSVIFRTPINPSELKFPPASSYADQESAARQAPEVGAIVDGYKFKGGDPGQQSNWEQVKK